MALHVALRTQLRLSGVILLDGWLSLAEEYPEALSERATQLRVLWAHGEKDPIVKHKWGHTSHEQLERMAVPSTFVTMEGLDHSADDALLAQTAAFMGELLCAGALDSSTEQPTEASTSDARTLRRRMDATGALAQTAYTLPDNSAALYSAGGSRPTSAVGGGG